MTIYHGDCRAVIPGLATVDAVITDPPYSSGGMVRGDRMASTRDKYQSTGAQKEHADFTGDNRDQRGFVAWASLWLDEALMVTRPGGMCCLFSDWRQLPSMTDALQAGGWVWRGIVPWDKVNSRPMPNRFSSQCEYIAWGTNGPRDFSTADAVYHPGILRELPPQNRMHASQKPVGIMQQLCAVVPRGGGYTGSVLRFRYHGRGVQGNRPQVYRDREAGTQLRARGRAPGAGGVGSDMKSCEQCGRPVAPGEWGRCLDCGKVCCRECKGKGLHLCNKCWDSDDGREADKIEREFDATVQEKARRG